MAANDKGQKTQRDFFGLNNVAPETAIPPGFMRGATNVDVDDGMNFNRRSGTAKALSFAFGRSGFVGTILPYVVVADATALKLIDANLAVHSTIPIDAYNDVTYAEAGPLLFFSDGPTLRCIDSSGTVHPGACPNPSFQPTATATANGGMQAGTYQVAITWTDELGRESGTGIAAVVTISQGQGIQLTGFPAPPNNVQTVRIYATECNGETLLLWQEYPAAITTEFIYGTQRGRQLETQFVEPMQGCSILAYCNGRLFGVRENIIGFSPPQRYGQWVPFEGYLKQRGGVQMIAPVGEGQAGAGLFISDDSGTYWLDATSMEWTDGRKPTQRRAYPFRAVPGTLCYVPGSLFGAPPETRMVAHWLSSNGVFCVGLPGGVVMPYTEGYALASPAQSGAAFFREQASMRQVVMALEDPGTRQNATASDFAVATVIRNGVAV
jgi:hypothetical protein